VYTGNLRKALARDTYILRGAAETAALNASTNGFEVYEPTFTQHGYRYIEIHGLSYQPALADVVSVELHSAVRDGGTISTSSALLNAIQQACVWTAKSNLMSIPTDCCQRNERRGWMGDAAIGAGRMQCWRCSTHPLCPSTHPLPLLTCYCPPLLSHMHSTEINIMNHRMAAFYTAFADLMRDDQGPDGSMPNWVPVFPGPYPGAGYVPPL
jgi:hypothetical protein